MPPPPTSPLFPYTTLFRSLIIAGAWSAQGGAPYASITAAAVAACLIADLGWYVTGRRLGSRVLRAMCRLTLEPDSCVSDTERMFTRFGTRVLAFAKFVPGLGAVATGAGNGGVVVVYCACPNEATAARVAKRLISMGFHPVRPLAGGIHAWLDAGLAIERPG